MKYFPYRPLHQRYPATTKIELLLLVMMGGMAIAAYAAVTSTAHTVVDTKLLATPYTVAHSIATLATNTDLRPCGFGSVIDATRTVDAVR